MPNLIDHVYDHFRRHLASVLGDKCALCGPKIAHGLRTDSNAESDKLIKPSYRTHVRESFTCH